MSAVEGPALSPPPRGFNIGHQKLGLDVDFATRSLKGWTELTIFPTDPNLRLIRLNCRQSTITRILVNNKGPTSKHVDPFSKLKLHEMADVHQHHQLRQKLEPCLQDPLDGDLSIILPKSVKIELQDPFALAAQNALGAKDHVGMAKGESPDGTGVGTVTPAATTRPDAMPTYVPIQVLVEFTIEDFREGFHFVGSEDDLRYPHAYTTNNILPGSACSIFPCLDSLWERHTWEIEITCPKTLGDIGKSLNSRPPATAEKNDLYHIMNPHKRDNKDFIYEYKGEDGELEMMVTCVGQCVGEHKHPKDPSKKIYKFMLDTPTSAHHVAFAIGPFEKTNLTGLRESEEDEALGRNAVDAFAYCLPGREEEVKNTCMFLQKAIDFFVRTYGKYPYYSFSLCFVDDLTSSTTPSASLVLCSNRLLFTPDMIDPIYPATRKLTHALATQWSGVSTVPKEWQDLWVVVGIAYYMTGVFLRKLTGNNEYRFRLKKDAEKICELDRGWKSLYSQGWELPLTLSDLDFISLKAPLVLYILDRRLTKSSGSLGLARVIPKVFLQAFSGDLANGALSTAHFIKLCEKLGHTKLESFFQQWVYGTGYPRFEITQRFNKKKLIVEMIIRQSQISSVPQRHFSPEHFLQDAKEFKEGAFNPDGPQVFTGPMTIRLHEADGTPYEHVVEIKESYMKLEIPYMTKYKRIKRTKLQKERLAVTAGMDISADAQAEDVLLYCLGDVLQSDEDLAEWRLAEWSKEEEDRMAQEAFEWIRVDADFEWICTTTINQPDHMFLSQLQQDRDVIAQYESITHFANVPGSPVISSILARTLMDRRYYYGIRTEAALALAGCATQELSWIGQFHLQKAFQEFYCFPDSMIPRGNDFWDFTSYFVQLSILKGLSRIREMSGRSPLSVQQFLLDLLRYNDNSNNSFADHHYVSELMKSLQICIMAGSTDDYGTTFEYDEDDWIDTKQAVISEIDRIQRMDQWLPSYQNIISRTALEIKKELTITKAMKSDLTEFLAYTREGTSDALRLMAFECLIELGALRVPPVLRYICNVIGTDPSPYIRKQVLKLFLRGLGIIALGEAEKVESHDDMIVVQEAVIMKAEDDLATIEKALTVFRSKLATSQSLKESIWLAVTSRCIGLVEMRNLLDVCSLLFEERQSLIVRLKPGKPRRLIVKHQGHGKLRFIWHPTPEQVASFLPTPAPTPPAQAKPISISFKPLVAPSHPPSSTPVSKSKKDKHSKTRITLAKTSSPPSAKHQAASVVVHPSTNPPAQPRLKFKLNLKKKDISSGIPSPDNVF